MPRRNGLFAVLPARNEESRLGAVLEALWESVEDIVVIDDASEDRTGAIAERSGCHVVRLRTRAGVGAATLRGLSVALGLNASWSVTLDADGQHDPKWVSGMIESMRKAGADVVFGDRFQSLVGIPLTKRLSNNLGWHCVRSVLGANPCTRDVSCGMRIYGPRALQRLAQWSRGQSLGYAFVQASYCWLHRRGLRIIGHRIPAIYVGRHGTPCAELSHFLRWAARHGELRTLVSRLNGVIATGGSARFKIESWREAHRLLRVVAHRRGDEIFFGSDKLPRQARL